MSITGTSVKTPTPVASATILCSNLQAFAHPYEKKKIKKVCIISGIAINRMCSGLFNIVFPWKENIITKVKRGPSIVTLSNFFKNTFSKYYIPLYFTIYFLDKYPSARGITTNNITDKNKVSYGTLTSVTPSKNETIGVKATNNIKSLIAT